MPQRLHLVFGGELVDTQRGGFRDWAEIETVGVFPDCATAWKGKQQATDSADIVHFHRLRDMKVESGPTEELG